MMCAHHDVYTFFIMRSMSGTAWITSHIVVMRLGLSVEPVVLRWQSVKLKFFGLSPHLELKPAHHTSEALDGAVSEWYPAFTLAFNQTIYILQLDSAVTDKPPRVCVALPLQSYFPIT
jgi:hypothetical protein